MQHACFCEFSTVLSELRHMLAATPRCSICRRRSGLAHGAFRKKTPSVNRARCWASHTELAPTPLQELLHD